MGHSSNSLAGALVDSTSIAAPSVLIHQSSVISQQPENDEAVETVASGSFAEAHISQSCDPESTTVPRTHYPTIAIDSTSAVPNDASRSRYQPMSYDQLALVPRHDLPNVTPDQMQGKRPSQISGLTQHYHYRPEASGPTLPKRPPVKVRFPSEPDRTRLAKDILKQLGKPIGLVPALPTRRERKERKKLEADTEGTPIHPSTEPAAEVQLVLNLNDAPLPPDPVPDQVVVQSTSPPQEIPVNKPPSLGSPDQHRELAPPNADAIERDVDMDIEPSINPSVPQPSGSPRPIPPQDYTSSLVDPKSVRGEGRSSAAESPPSEPRSSGWIGPPPDAEVIEISDDEGQPVVGAMIVTVEPMEVDGKVAMGRTISKSLSQLSLNGDDTPVSAEMEKNLTEKPLGRRSSQEPVASKDIQFTEKKLQKVQPYVEVPPLPDYARRREGKERAPVGAEDEEGLYGVCMERNWFLTPYSSRRSRTSSCHRLGVF